MPDVEETINAADALYKSVADASVDEHGGRTRQFAQDQLLALSGLPDTKALMPLIQYLTNQQLLRTLKVQGKLAWTVRPRAAAQQIRALDRDDKVVYGVIEEAHDRGIWSRDIKKRAGGLADNVVKRSLDKMEKANLIKGIKSVKSPAQRTYMLAHLVPSEEVTGNSFYDAGDLDESFRDELMKLIVFWVRSKSWPETKRRAPAPASRREMSPIAIDDDDDGSEPHTNGHGDASGQHPKRKRPHTSIGDIEDSGQHRFPKRRLDPAADTALLYKAGTHAYPTAQQIYDFITGSNVIKPTKASSLTVTEITDCINVLRWDDKLEEVENGLGEKAYRTVRGVSYNLAVEEEGAAGTALTQVPCGSCPVFDVCTEGGPVNARECVYLDEWLKS